MSSPTYAQAKGRSPVDSTLSPGASVAADREAEEQAKRIAAENAPLTEDEEERARANWNHLRRDLPWMAEFVKALADNGEFNGRRALASMTITPTATDPSDLP